MSSYILFTYYLSLAPLEARIAKIPISTSIVWMLKCEVRLASQGLRVGGLGRDALLKGFDTGERMTLSWGHQKKLPEGGVI